MAFQNCCVNCYLILGTETNNVKFYQPVKITEKKKETKPGDDIGKELWVQPSF